MNSVVHFEIPAKDKQRSKKFYESVFGWKFQDMPEMNYTIVHTVEVDENQMPKEAGAINGGMMVEKDNGGMNPVLVINVPSVDDYLKKVVKAGGKELMPKMKVGDMGYYARVTDTEGMVVGIWEMI
ncbi:MAG: VOC family protein [Patescibacteria group bacterium]